MEELVWAFRHDTISATYFDEVAAKFFQPKLRGGRATEKCVKPEVKSDRYTVYSRSDNEAEMQVVPPNGGGDGKTIFEKLEDESGCALGPHWLAKLNQQQRHSGEVQISAFISLRNYLRLVVGDCLDYFLNLEGFF